MTSKYPFTELPTIDDTIAKPLKKLLGDDFFDLVNDFFTDFPSKFSDLKAARTSNDVDSIFRISHTLKSSSGSFGFTRLYKCLEHLEVQARNNNIIDPDNQIKLLEQEFGIVVSTLSED